jgi:hypothetical protein
VFILGTYASEAAKRKRRAEKPQRVVRRVVCRVVVVRGDEPGVQWSTIDIVNSSSCSSMLRDSLARSLERPQLTHQDGVVEEINVDNVEWDDTEFPVER